MIEAIGTDYDLPLPNFGTARVAELGPASNCIGCGAFVARSNGLSAVLQLWFDFDARAPVAGDLDRARAVLDGITDRVGDDRNALDRDSTEGIGTSVCNDFIHRGSYNGL